jgi:hypothetical protein
MTGLPTAQPNHSLATAHAPAQVALWPPGVPALALVGSRAWARVIRQARCAESTLDADVWFPVSPGAQQARQEAAAAIAICRDCPVRSQCLALSLRHWDIGQHGVWGGMVAAERASLRRQMVAHRADALRYFTDEVGLPSLPLTSPASTTAPRRDSRWPHWNSAGRVQACCMRPGQGRVRCGDQGRRRCTRTVVSASPFPGCGGWPLPTAPPWAGTRWPGSRQSAQRNRHQRAWRS